MTTTQVRERPILFSATKERPIIFSTAMVECLLDGCKTQTRRVFVPPGDEPFDVGFYHPTCVKRDGEEYPGPEVFGASCADWGVKCPYGAPGDELWVRETWAAPQAHNHTPASMFAGSAVWYEAGNGKEGPHSSDRVCVRGRWRPSIHMPRWASRLQLRVKAVRVERLQEISEADAKAEGYESIVAFLNGDWAKSVDLKAWVWVIEFERVKP